MTSTPRDLAFARLSAGDREPPNLGAGLCADDRHEPRETRTRNTAATTAYDGEMTLNGPFGGNTDEFKEFEKKVLVQKNNGSLRWMCGNDAGLVNYVRGLNGLLKNIREERSVFGLFLATIPVTKTAANDTCDQPLAFILYRDTTTGDTRLVHVDLVCRGKINDTKSGAFVRGSDLYRHAEDAILESTSDDVARVQFSLDSIESARTTYERWGYSNITYANGYTPAYNEKTKAWPMTKVFERTADEKMRAFVLKVFARTFDPVDGNTHAFRVNEGNLNFDNSNYGRVDVSSKKMSV